MLIGYARVSTDDQHLDLQRDTLTRSDASVFMAFVGMTLHGGSRVARHEDSVLLTYT